MEDICFERKQEVSSTHIIVCINLVRSAVRNVNSFSHVSFTPSYSYSAIEVNLGEGIRSFCLVIELARARCFY
jgi:hypothetical protein